MSDIVQALIKRSSVFIIITGVILLVIGASNGINFGTFSFQLSNQITQWVIIATSLLLIFVGIYWETKSNKFSFGSSKSFGLFTSDTDTFANLKIDAQIATAKSIELLGYNLKSLLQELREPLAKAVVRGASVRIILVDIESNVTQEMFKQHSNRPHLMLPEWVTALEHIGDIQKMLQVATKLNGKLEVKVTDWIPSCNLIIFNSDEDNGLIKVGIHTVTIRQPLTGRLSLILSKKENQNAFEYFAKGFNMLWEKDSREWNGVVPPLEPGK
ncbi:MAG: hypothetical protein HY867_01735 [Chloroflexi bacterium]|nr:hypothetical protein [Chloroflexota bacterium]